MRWNPVVELAMTCLRRSSVLRLAPINLELSVSPGDVLIDCGANVGVITAKFARTGATVHAFEPDSACFKVLRRRFLWIRNVHLHNQGVMDRDCILTLVAPCEGGGYDRIETTTSGTFLSRPGIRPESMRETQVQCIDLVAFIRKFERVRVLKLDIEGAELQILNALIDTGAIDLVDQVIAETHEVQMPHLTAETDALRDRIAAAGLGGKIRLDWI